MKHKAIPNRYTVQDYMDEQIDYGGEILPRSAVIEQMRSIGLTSREIDLYLFGADRRKELDRTDGDQP
jgi:hypothetical protein